MKRSRVVTVLAWVLVLWLAAAPAWGVNKDMVQLQTQVEQLQQQMTSMQRSFDERMGVMKNLVEQDSDAINKALADPAVTDSLKKAGVDPTPGSTPATTADFVKAELAKWAPIIKASGAQVD